MTPILYQDRQIDLTDPLFVRLINCVTNEDRARFVERFGDVHPRLSVFANYLRSSAEVFLGSGDGETSRGRPSAADLEHVNLGLLYNVAVEPRLAMHEGGNIRFVIEVPSLREFMALELAAAVEAGARTKRCGHCNKLFLHGPLTGRRSHARYCADKCRVAAMRARNAS